VTDYEFVTAVNLSGFFHITQRAVAQMLAQGEGGHVVNVTTTLVEHADSKIPAGLAALTKGGLAAAARSLAIEYAHNGIRFNVISPGHIGTPMHAGGDTAALASSHPLGRMGSIADIVQGVLYLENATFVTGQILHVVGGQSAGH
jgi:NAD(P)-dependent dehydrogenase (short-subunit alcohol dehydrogenase family)